MFLLLLSSLFLTASGHGQLTNPAPRQNKNGDTQRGPAYFCSGPRSSQPAYTTTSTRCGDATTPTALTTVNAGSSFTTSWNFEAAHAGDCTLWISYDTDKASPQNWVKLGDYPGCGATNALLNNPSAGAGSFNWDIPAELPACEHCVMRWDWYTVQQVSNIEFYQDCFDVKIASSATGTPIPTTAINDQSYFGACPGDFYNAYNQHDTSTRIPGPAVWAKQTTGGDGDINAAAGVSFPVLAWLLAVVAAYGN